MSAGKISQHGFVEYTYGDSTWRIDCGQEMLRDFKIEGSEEQMLEEVSRWHGALCDQSQIWRIVTRLFAITPLFGCEDPEEMKPWKMEKIAERMGISVREVESGFAEAKAFWNRWHSSKTMVAEPEREPETVVGLSEAAIKKLLSTHGFEYVSEEEERKWVASRIMDLQSLMDNEGQRSMARALIEMEFQMFFMITPAIYRLHAQIRQKIKEHGENVSVRELEERIGKQTTARNNLQSQIEASMKVLGITEAQTSAMQRKRLFRDSLGTLVEAVSAYEARGDRELIDGVWTAAEVEVLTTEFTARPFQYRPDLALVVPEAVERLFDPTYEPGKLSRRSHRRLLGGFKVGLAAVRSQDDEAMGELDPESVEERAESMAIQAEQEGRVASAPDRFVPGERPAVRPLPPRRSTELADW